MSLTDLINLPVTIVRRSQDESEAFDPVPTEFLFETVGYLEQTQRTEPVAEGELSVTTWLLVLPAGTDVRTGDAVIEGGVIYEVIGDPASPWNPRTRLHGQVEATLKKTGGDEGGS
jgi:hypothetical protein